MAISKTDLGTFHDLTTATSRTFGPFTVGADGLFVAVIVGKNNGNPTVNTLTIGGNAATVHVYQNTNSQMCLIASAAVTAGSRSVAISYNGGIFDNPGNADQFCTGVLLQGGASYLDSDSAIASASSIAATLDTAASGAVVYGVTVNANAAVGWSAADEDDDQVTADTYRAAVASKLTGAESNHVETASWTGTNLGGIAAASFGAALAYTLTAVKGTYTLSGIAALFHKTLSLSVARGTFAVTGVAAVLTKIIEGLKYRLRAATGVFTYRGAWHSPNPDWDVKRRKNRWWRRLLNG